MPAIIEAYKNIPIFHFEDEMCSVPGTIVLGSGSDEALKQVLGLYQQDEFEIITVDLDGGSYHLALRGFEIFRKGCGGSKSSQAQYWAKREMEDYGFLVQSLQPRKKTSSHLHKIKKETFYPIVGSCYLSNGEKKLPVAHGHTVPTNSLHCLITDGRPSLNLIRIVGPDPLGKSDFYFPEQD
jgi:mannose-6-phosphate isomerase-like protein (cupin superfamily)